MTARWKQLGLALRLDIDVLNTIEKQYRDLDDCLTQTLTLWLKKKYKTEKYGQPSWGLLVEAVRKSTGGNDPALAEKISKKHAGNVI